MARFALIVSAFSALIITLISGIFMVPFLRKLHFGQTINTVGPTWHKDKNGTPTMGGLTFYLGSLIGVALGYIVLASGAPDVLEPTWARNNGNLVIAIATAVCFGLIGFVDDYIKVVKKRNLGLKARYKIVLQVMVTAAFLSALYINGSLSTSIVLPVIGIVDLGYFFYPLSFLLIIFIVNAVNLTDGVDGLASGVTFVVMLGFMLIAGLLGNTMIALFAGALAGGCAGFLAWNFHPAKMFMGDTGSMFLGGAVVALAFAMQRPELLLLLGFVYICEAGSVVIQVTYFKLTHGKRVFKMTPIHHHFEMSGWSEEKIVAIFSFVAFVFVALACVFVYSI
ncbi:MAG: phospho-N-acetylmuramoyl-pentapeptide-transferase [Oscillospiraceae bacterium]